VKKNKTSRQWQKQSKRIVAALASWRRSSVSRRRCIERKKHQASGGSNDEIVAMTMASWRNNEKRQWRM